MVQQVLQIIKILHQYVQNGEIDTDFQTATAKVSITIEINISIRIV